MQDSDWKYNELPTPGNIDEMDDLMGPVFGDRLNLLTERKGWKIIYNVDGLLIEEKYVPGHSISMIRSSVCHKTIHPEKALDIIYSGDYEDRLPYYDDLSAHYVVQNINPKLHVALTKFKTPSVISDREFLTLRGYKVLDSGTHLVAIQSINSPKVPFDKNAVRGISNCGAMTSTPDRDGYSVIVTVDHIQPKGWVPSFIVNSYKQKIGFKLKRLVEGVCQDSECHDLTNLI